MIEVHLIGYTSDLRHLVLDLEDDAEGGRYRLAVDGDLFLTVDEIRERRRRTGMDVGIPYDGFHNGPDSGSETAALDSGAEPRDEPRSGPRGGGREDVRGEVGDGVAHEAGHEPETLFAPAPGTSGADPARPGRIRPEPAPNSFNVRLVGPDEVARAVRTPLPPPLGSSLRSTSTAGVVGTPLSPDAIADASPPAPEGRAPPAAAGESIPEPTRSGGRPPEAADSETPEVEADDSVDGAGWRAAPVETPDSDLTPAEIQSLLRAGRSPRWVAKHAGTGIAWIERWLPPILAEREQVLDEAHATHVDHRRDGRSRLPLAGAVARTLRQRGVDPDEISWNVKRRSNGRWSVNIRFEEDGRTRSATWALNRETGELTASSDIARELGWTVTGRRAGG